MLLEAMKVNFSRVDKTISRGVLQLQKKIRRTGTVLKA